MLSKSTLKQKTPLTRKTPMSQGSGFKRSGFTPKTFPTEALTKDPKPAPKPKKRLKSTKQPPTAEESRHMGRVAELSCIVCKVCLGIDGTPAIVHHMRTDTGKTRASHFDTMPLCPPHHQHSGYGIHDMGRKQFLAMYGKTEVELLHIVQTILAVPLWKSYYLPG